jgi:hypothetical protein
MVEGAMSDIYVISYDATRMSQDEIEKFFIYVKNNRYVDDWHAPFLGSVFVKSDFGAPQIASSINDFMKPDLPCIVTRANLGGNAAFIPTESWQWLAATGLELSDL